MIQTVQRANPESMLAVLINTGHVTVTQAVRVFRVVFVYRHLIPVVTIQAVPSAQPHEAPMILVDGFNGAVGKAVFILDVFEVEFGFLRLGVSPG